MAHLMDELVAEMMHVVARADVDAVHDLRVSVRRAAAAVRLSESHVTHAQRLRKEIKVIRERASAVRDRDVTRHLLRRHRLPASDPACVYLQGQRDLAAAQLQDYLAKQFRRDRPQRWLKWLEA